MKRSADPIFILIPIVLLGCVAASIVMHEAGLAFLSLVALLASLWLIGKLTDRDQ